MGKNIKELIDLGIAAANKTVPTQFSTYSVSDLDNALREEVRTLSSSYSGYRNNKNTIFEIIEKVADAVAPKRVTDQFGTFAEVQTFKQNQKATFKRKLGKNRARRTFVTTSAIGGTFRTARLDSTNLTLNPYAHAGGATISLEEFLDGTIDMNDIIEVIAGGLADTVFFDIQKALLSSYSATGRPSNTIASSASFDEATMMGVVNTVRAYGGNASVFCTYGFASLMRPTYGAIGTFSSNVLTDDQRDIRDQGYVGKIQGAPVLAIQQSFTDETNAHYETNPKVSYIFPSGGDKAEKPVKVAFEGSTIVDEVKNADRSMDFTGYKKSAVGVLNTNNWGIYENRGVSDVGSDWDNIGS